MKFCSMPSRDNFVTSQKPHSSIPQLATSQIYYQLKQLAKEGSKCRVIVNGHNFHVEIMEQMVGSDYITLLNILEALSQWFCGFITLVSNGESLCAEKGV